MSKHILNMTFHRRESTEKCFVGTLASVEEQITRHEQADKENNNAFVLGLLGDYGPVPAVELK